MVGLFSRTVVAMTVRMPRWFVGWVSRRYVAGPKLEDAVKVMKRLSSEGSCFTIDVLGENLTKDKKQVFGRSEYMTPVIFDGEKKEIGNIVKVKIENCNQNTLFGKIDINNMKAA